MHESGKFIDLKDNILKKLLLDYPNKELSNLLVSRIKIELKESSDDRIEKINDIIDEILEKEERKIDDILADFLFETNKMIDEEIENNKRLEMCYKLLHGKN